MKYSLKPASRILVNTGGSQGGTGISTGLPTSFTLGCGTYGGSSVSENISPKHLINVKKVAYGIKDCRNMEIPNSNIRKTCSINNKNDLNLSPAEIAATYSNKSHEGNCSEGKNKNLEDLVREINLSNKKFSIIILYLHNI